MFVLITDSSGVDVTTAPLTQAAGSDTDKPLWETRWLVCKRNTRTLWDSNPIQHTCKQRVCTRDRPERGQWVYASCLLLRTAQASTRWFHNSCCIFLKWNRVKSMKMIKLLLLTTQVNCRQNAEQNKRERDYILHKYLQHADITYDRLLEAQKGPSSEGEAVIGKGWGRHGWGSKWPVSWPGWVRSLCSLSELYTRHVGSFLSMPHFNKKHLCKRSIKPRQTLSAGYQATVCTELTVFLPFYA